MLLQLNVEQNPGERELLTIREHRGARILFFVHWQIPYGLFLLRYTLHVMKSEVEDGQV